jgi:hypothetical protein
MAELRWLLVDIERVGRVRFAVPADSIQPGDKMPVVIGISEAEDLNGYSFEGSLMGDDDE